MVNQAFCDLFLTGITDGCPMTWNWDDYGEIDILTIRKSTEFLYPDDNWEDFAAKTQIIYENKGGEDYWRFNGKVWLRSFDIIHEDPSTGDLIGLWLYGVAADRHLIDTDQYKREHAGVYKQQLWDTEKPISCWKPIFGENGEVVDSELLWKNPSWVTNSPNTAYRESTLLSEGAPVRLKMFLSTMNESTEHGVATLNIPRADTDGVITLTMQYTNEGLFLCSFASASIFHRLLDHASPTFIMKVDVNDPGPRTNRLVMVNKAFTHKFLGTDDVPPHMPSPKTYGTTDILMDDFIDELCNATVDIAPHTEATGRDWWRTYQAEALEILRAFAVENDMHGVHTSYMDSPYGPMQRIVTFLPAEDGTLHLSFNFTPASAEQIMTAPQFAIRRTNLLGQQVKYLTRAIAAHKPIFDKDGELVDMEFLWANDEFNKWRGNVIQPGMLNSTERVRFEELLPYLQRAWEEGQVSQFFTLQPEDLADLKHNIYDYSDALQEEDRQVNKIEMETLFSRTQDGYIIEWGDDIKAKIQHGSEVEIQRKRVEDLEKEKVQQRERDHFISEIHDNTLQELFVIGMGLQQFMKEGSLSPTVQNVHEFAGAIDRIAKDLRVLITNEMEQRNPFDEQLRVIAQRYSRISEFEVTFVNTTVDDDINLERLPQNLCDDLSKATQEAVSNAVKHSEGDEIRIQLTMESNNLTLTVDDNGTGIDDVTIRKSGTRNMEQRVEKHQGLFFIENITTGGTRVIFQIDNIPLVTI